jgi:hypothetical protein
MDTIATAILTVPITTMATAIKIITTVMEGIAIDTIPAIKSAAKEMKTITSMKMTIVRRQATAVTVTAKQPKMNSIILKMKMIPMQSSEKRYIQHN